MSSGRVASKKSFFPENMEIATSVESVRVSV